MALKLSELLRYEAKTKTCVATCDLVLVVMVAETLSAIKTDDRVASFRLQLGKRFCIDTNFNIICRPAFVCLLVF